MALDQEMKNIEGGEPNKSQGRSKAVLVLSMIALSTSSFLAALDQTIVSTALPTISEQLHLTEADFVWIGSAYLLGAASGVPVWGKISDIFGRRPIILLASCTFFGGSLMCALSGNNKVLEAGRAIQGIGGGGLLNLVNVCISDMFSLRERGLYMGMMGLVFAFASAVGPILGGAFTEFVTWRWCFYINLPLAGLSTLLLFGFLRLETPKTPLVAGLRSIDWLGSVLIIGGTVCFLLGLQFGGVLHGWNNPTVICLIVFGLVLLGLFVAAQRWISPYPIFPSTVLAKRSNIGALLVTFCHGFTMISGMYFLPIYFQVILDATAILSGVYLLPYACVLSLAAVASGIYTRKTGQFVSVMIVGFAFMTLGFGLFIDLPAYPSWPRIIIYQIIAGIGVGMLFNAPLLALQAHSDRRDVASATGAFGFTRNLSTAMSITVGGAIFQNEVGSRAASLGGQLSPGIIGALERGVTVSVAAVHTITDPAETQLVLNVLTDSLHVLWIVMTIVAFVGLLSSLLVRQNALDKTHQETRVGLEAEKEKRRDRLVKESGEAEIVVSKDTDTSASK